MDAVVTKMTLRTRILHALGWTAMSRPLAMVVQLVRSLILTELLAPAAFGLMAVVGVVQTAIQMWSDLGINVSIIQSQRGDDPVFLKTAWTVGIIRGFVLWLISCAAAVPVAWFYDEPMLRWLIPVNGVSLFMMSFASTGFATRRRHMDLKQIEIFSMVMRIVGLAVVIALAWQMRSVWALVIGSVVVETINMLAGHYYIRNIRHRFCWDPESVRELVGFGRWVFVSTLLTFFAMNADKLLLGKLVSMSELGVYSIALVLTGIPLTLVGIVSGTLLLPTLSEKFRGQKNVFNKNAARARALVLKVAALLIAGVVATGPGFFGLFYDPRYEEAGWISQWLCGSLWFTVLSMTAGNVLLAMGDSRSVALSHVANVVVTLVGCIVGFHYLGLVGFVTGYAIGTASGQVVQLFYLRRHNIDLARQDASYTVVAGFVILLIVLTQYVLRSGESDWSIVIRTGASLGVWLLLALSVLPSIFDEVMPGRVPKAVGENLVWQFLTKKGI